MTERRKVRFRYTLRALLVFITLFMLWGGYHTNRSWKERAAEQFLRERGASFQYGRKYTGTDIRSRIAAAYEKLVQTVWRERLITFASVHGPLEPEVVDAIVALPHLESLMANPGPRMTEQELALLRRKGIVEAKVAAAPGAVERILANHRLKGLWMATWILSDEDCAAIANHDSLQELNLYGSALSEHGFAEILRLPRLESLTFSYCQVTGANVSSVPGSHSLDVVECYHAPVGNEFAAFIGRSPNVTEVRFDHPEIDDEFIANIGPHPSLLALNLGRSRVTDQSIVVIMKMRSLQAVQFNRTIVSQDAIARLKASNPRVVIQY